jgi:hypothetical protein
MPIEPTPSDHDPLVPPPDTHNRPERNSRLVVRDSDATLWRAAADGVIHSCHLNARFVPLCIASPTREGGTADAAAPPLLPFQRQTRSPRRAPSPPPPPPPPPLLPPLPPPPVPPPPVPPRTSPTRPRPALGEIHVNVLRDELRKVEHDCARLKAHSQRQEATIHSLCAWIANR